MLCKLDRIDEVFDSIVDKKEEKKEQSVESIIEKLQILKKLMREEEDS